MGNIIILVITKICKKELKKSELGSIKFISFRLEQVSGSIQEYNLLKGKEDRTQVRGRCRAFPHGSSKGRRSKD